MQVFKGTSANPGIAIGPAYHFNRALIAAEDRNIDVKDLDAELTLLERAVALSSNELERIIRIAESKTGDQGAEIFQSQMMMVNDPVMLGTIRSRIITEKKSASYIVDNEFGKFQKLLAESNNPLMVERADDVEDVKQRILRHLLKKDHFAAKFSEPAIVVAEFLSPADAVLFTKEELLGFAMDGGGVTSHVSILARSAGLPVIVALRNASSHVATGAQVILDGDNGLLIIDPDEITLAEYRSRLEQHRISRQVSTPETLRFTHPKTKDGKTITVSMNMELIGTEAIKEAKRVSQVKGKNVIGLGLVRTEHFLNSNDEIPTEEEQTTIYSDIVREFAPTTVTIRTFDIGGDKFIGGSFHEKNPFLGWRGIRISLDEPEMFQAQIRSILRASSYGSVRLMLPMLTSIDELDRTLSYIESAKTALRANGESFNEDIPIGAMIEVPAAALAADIFAKKCDFLSIGSNDLTQYTLAVDRGNAFITHLFDELHPSVLRLMGMVVAAAHKHKKPVSLCGEMASKPLSLPVIIGLGIDEISVSPSNVRSISQKVGSLSYLKCRALVKKINENATTAEMVRTIVRDFLSNNKIILSSTPI